MRARGSFVHGLTGRSEGSRRRAPATLVRRMIVVASCQLVVLGMIGATASATSHVGRTSGHDRLPIGFSQGAPIPASYPSAWDVASAYDTSRNQVVLFGGSPAAAGSAFNNQTWLYSNGTWSQGPSAPSQLTKRGGSAMAFFPDIGKTVLFGGTTAAWPPLNDDWLFDGNKWTQGPAVPAGLTGRVGAGMAYDAAIHKLVLFGGMGTTPCNDTWLFDGTKWTKGPRTPAGMVARAYFGMAYDPVLGQVLVAGGDGDTDTWLYNGTRWSAGPPLPSSLPLERFKMDYDPELGGIAFIGGIGPAYANKQLWYLADGLVWTQILSHGGLWPAGRIEPAILYDPAQAALLVIGGIDAQSSNGGSEFHELWLYNATNAAPRAPAPRRELDLTVIPSGGLRVDGGARASGAPERSGPVTPATGQITAHDGKFWLGVNQVRLHGLNGGVGTANSDTYAQMATWGFNLVRLHVIWAFLEPQAPKLVGSTWTHTYDQQGYLQDVLDDVSWAQQAGLYVLIENAPCDLGATCDPYPFGFPNYLYSKQYNSLKVDYLSNSQGITQAKDDFWNDANRQQFDIDFMTYLARQLQAQPGVMGYELANEPQVGDLDESSSLTATTMGFQYVMATAIRAVDPGRVIVFTTRQGLGQGVLDAQAELGLFAALPGSPIGNVAFDLHDYFGARWGDGFMEDPANPSYRETTQVLLASTATQPTISYIGTIGEQERFLSTVSGPLTALGIPLLVGEMGAYPDDMGVASYYTQVTSAANTMGVAWCAWFSGVYGIVDSNGQLTSWGQIVVDATKG